MVKKQVSRSEARRVAEKAVKALRPYCQRVEVCGSYRRLFLEVGDVDIVAVAKSENSFVWAGLEVLAPTRIRGGTSEAKLGCFEIDGVQVDVWLVPAESWGAALMFATGPVERNKRQRQHARRQGMVLNQYGLFNEATGEVLASKTEKDIYDALGETYREPWER
jgi:DNA polymerase (family 10)